jgi:hypothetical protein
MDTLCAIKGIGNTGDYRYRFRLDAISVEQA